MNYIKNEYSELFIQDGVLFFKYLPFENFDLAAAEKIVAARLSLQREIAFPVLCDVRQIGKPNLSARRFLAVQGSVLAKAVAYVANSYSKEKLADFFITVDQPTAPTAVFSTQEAALQFLKPYVSE
ncbi:hypothetical protein SAMN04487907_1109 [Zunongwangia mangrovi]|uniref:DUF7793 domain-containing protein n=1 Tax=Zunongwangia mangrovi TaxID=1334022 RepID=A0A1I1MLY4_9FLAO|nr:hypothetical protein [Zunongwangia mangrovi]SFC85842.1 hypothetical protein SAMN04487907_1109 [Zunongwangia mangrovi]